jgi:hypothetical protein
VVNTRSCGQTISPRIRADRVWSSTTTIRARPSYWLASSGSPNPACAPSQSAPASISSRT